MENLSKIPATTITFQGGAYGHYLKWILYTLLVDGPFVDPFYKSTSHRMYIDNELADKVVAKKHVTIDSLFKNRHLKLSTIHPVTDFGLNFIDEVEKISELVDCVLIPYIDHSTYLLGVHNWLYKVYDNIWNGPLLYADKENIYNGWNVDRSADLESIPKWILREHHSLNIFNSWESQVQWFAPARMANPSCKFVFINDLFYNFLPTIESIRKFLDVQWVRDPSELLPYHKINVSKQKYKNQDPLAKQILQSISDDGNFTWNADSITLYTEAYIQSALQQQGIMLKCNGLNDFPTSTNALIEVFE